MRLQEVHTTWREVIYGELFLASSLWKKKKGKTSNSVSKCWLFYCPVLKEVGEKSNLTTENCSREKHLRIELRELKSTKSTFFFIYKEGTSLKREKNSVMSRYFSQSIDYYFTETAILIIRERSVISLLSAQHVVFTITIVSVTWGDFSNVESYEIKCLQTFIHFL